MEPQYCADEDCVKHTEHRGGRFRYSVAEGKTYCEECFGLHMIHNDGKNLWDFTTTHFTGSPVHVKNLGHLRQLERQHGVSNQLANNYERNCK